MKLVKEVILGFLKVLFSSLVSAVKVAVKKIDYKAIAFKIYEEAKPSLKEKVSNTESSIDDRAYDAINYLAEKFLKPKKENV